MLSLLQLSAVAPWLAMTLLGSSAFHRTHGAAHRAAASSFAVTGTVVDGEGNPLDESEIALIDRDSPRRTVRSDDRGRFHIDSLPYDTATLRVRHVGFRARVLGVRIVGDRTASMFVKLERSTATMPTMNIDGEAPDGGSDQLKEFHARAQSNHFGHFLDEARL